MSDCGCSKTDKEKRTFLIAGCAGGGALGAAGLGALVSSFQPSERAKAAGAPVEVDIADLKEGEMKIAEWRGTPVWILRRTAAMLATLKITEPGLVDPGSDRRPDYTPKYAHNQHRSIKPEFLIVIGICTHLGCSPNQKLTPGPQPSLPNDWQGGFLCPCHGSTFDLAARVFKNKPAPDNLPVPRHMYLSDTRIVIGRDQEGEA